MPRNAGRPPEAWGEGRCKPAISPFSRLHTVCLDLRFPAPENCETIKFCFLNCSAFACCRELGNESLISHSSLVASLLKLSDFIPTLRRSCHCQFPSMLKGSDQTKLSLVSLFVGVLLQVYDVIRILIFFPAWYFVLSNFLLFISFTRFSGFWIETTHKFAYWPLPWISGEPGDKLMCSTLCV